MQAKPQPTPDNDDLLDGHVDAPVRRVYGSRLAESVREGARYFWAKRGMTPPPASKTHVDPAVFGLPQEVWGE